MSEVVREINDHIVSRRGVQDRELDGTYELFKQNLKSSYLRETYTIPSQKTKQ